MWLLRIKISFYWEMRKDQEHVNDYNKKSQMLFWTIHQKQLKNVASHTAQKMKFSIKDFFSKCNQIRSFLRIWSHLLKKSFMENFVFRAVTMQFFSGKVQISARNTRSSPFSSSLGNVFLLQVEIFQLSHLRQFIKSYFQNSLVSLLLFFRD